MPDMPAAIAAKSLKLADPAGFEPAAFGFVVRGGVPVTCRESKRNRQDGAGRVVPTLLRVLPAVALAFFSLASCSHASASSFAASELATAKLDALKQIVKAEAVTADTLEVKRAAPVRIVVDEAWDEPAPTPANPDGKIHHPKRTTFDQGPVETTKTTAFKREGREEEQDTVRAEAEKKTTTAGASSSSTSVGPPRWFWALLPVLALGVLAAAWKLKASWLGWLR
jgi:hypothetical protein